MVGPSLAPKPPPSSSAEDGQVEAAAAAEEEILEAVDEAIANTFKLRSNDEASHDVEATYVTLLTEMLQVVAKGGTLGLLERLKGTFREGKAHRYASKIYKALHLLAQNIDVVGRSAASCSTAKVESDGALIEVVSYCLRQIFSSREQHS